MYRRSGHIMMGSTVAAGLLLAPLTACAQPASQAAGSQKTSVQSANATEVYVVPAAVKTQDGTLFAHRIGTTTASDLSLGRGTDAIFVPSSAGDISSAQSHFQWYSSANSAVTTGGPGLASTTETIGTSSVPITSLTVGDLQYSQVNESVVATSGTKITQTYALPTLNPDPTAGQFPAGYKGLYEGVSTGAVTGLVPTTAGHVLAFTSTGRAAAVTDLMTGKTVELSGFASLGSAARTLGGQLLVLAWRGNEPTFTMHVLTLDANFHVTATLDTRIRPDNYLRDQIVPGAGGADALVTVARGDETAGVTLSVFAVSGPHLAAMPALPLNVGLQIAPSVGTKVYVFGGPAKNTVSELDVASHALTRDVPPLRVPAGAFVVGITG